MPAQYSETGRKKKARSRTGGGFESAFEVTAPGQLTFTISRTSNSLTGVVSDSAGADTYECRVNAGTWVAGLTVSGLTDSTSYDYEARGINSAGAGPGKIVATTTAAPAGTWRAMEPAGMTAVQPLTFDQNLADDPNWGGYNVGRLSYVIDPDSPSPGDNVGRSNYPAGFTGGKQAIGISSSPQDASVGDVKHLYYCIGLKMSPNFQFHNTGTNKITFIGISGFGNDGDPYFCNIDSDSSPAQFRGVLQGPLSRIFPGAPAAEMLKDQWYTIEVEMVMNTLGNADGVYRQWVNGALSNEHLDVQYCDTGFVFDIPGINNTWGGSGDTVVEDFYLDISELHVSWSAN